jgi:cyanophycinase
VSERSLQPLYLLADSQILFWKTRKGPFLATLRVTEHAPRVAYIGASNGDSPEAYGILTAALEGIEIDSVHHVTAAFTDEDREALEAADIVVLAGGDVEAGWNAFASTGMRDAILACYRNGATLIGVSAGAVQFGTHATVRTDSSTSRLIETFGFVRLIVDVHDEADNWPNLSNTIHLLEGTAVGVGIRRGGGLMIHPDGVLEPIRQIVDQITYDNGKLRHAVIVPDLVP